MSQDGNMTMLNIFDRCGNFDLVWIVIVIMIVIVIVIVRMMQKLHFRLQIRIPFIFILIFDTRNVMIHNIIVTFIIVTFIIVEELIVKVFHLCPSFGIELTQLFQCPWNDCWCGCLCYS